MHGGTVDRFIAFERSGHEELACHDGRDGFASVLVGAIASAQNGPMMNGGMGGVGWMGGYGGYWVPVLLVVVVGLVAWIVMQRRK